MSGGIIDVLHFAIDSIGAQQSAVANNIANAQTPNYHATDVSFEQSLQQALASPGGAVAHSSLVASSAPAAVDGNNVSLATDLVEAEKATLQYQTVTDSLNAQFRLIQGSTGGTYQ